MIDNSTKDKLENETPHFGNTVLGAVPSVVYNEDCIEGLKRFSDNHFDLAIVDPPYKDETIGLTAGFNRGHFKYEHFKQPNEEYFAELFRVSKNQIVWGFNYFLDKLPNTDSCIFWYKHQNGHFSEGELAWCSNGKTRMYDRAYQKDIGDKIHPTQKPIELYEWILLNYGADANLILDTHVGSGSSRIACHKMNKEFVGFEIDPDYYEAQEARFKKFVQQLRLW